MKPNALKMMRVWVLLTLLFKWLGSQADCTNALILQRNRETAIYLMAHGLIEFQTDLDSGQQTSSTSPCQQHPFLKTFGNGSVQLKSGNCRDAWEFIPWEEWQKEMSKREKMVIYIMCHTDS